MSRREKLLISVMLMLLAIYIFKSTKGDGYDYAVIKLMSEYESKNAAYDHIIENTGKILEYEQAVSSMKDIVGNIPENIVGKPDSLWLTEILFDCGQRCDVGVAKLELSDDLIYDEKVNPEGGYCIVYSEAKVYFEGSYDNILKFIADIKGRGTNIAVTHGEVGSRGGDFSGEVTVRLYGAVQQNEDSYNDR